MWTHGQILGLKSHKVLGLSLLQGPRGCMDEPYTEPYTEPSLEVMALPENLRVLAKLLALDLWWVTGPAKGRVGALPYLSDV